MSAFDRRQFLKVVLGNLAQATGTVVVAAVAVSTAKGQGNQSEATEPSSEDLQQRADRLAATENLPTAAEANEFLNGGFRNTPLGAFRNGPVGGFRNTPLGSFRNGPVGGFRNSPFLGGGSTWGNGGWPNGGWGGFHNGGWPNHVWRNW